MNLRVFVNQIKSCQIWEKGQREMRRPPVGVDRGYFADLAEISISRRRISLIRDW